MGMYVVVVQKNNTELSSYQKQCMRGAQSPFYNMTHYSMVFDISWFV